MSDGPTIDHRAAHRTLSGDSLLGPVVERNGLLRLEPADDVFARLCRSVVRQQISMHAADAIFSRLEVAVDVTPESIQAADETALRDVGLSRSKARTLQAVADVWIDDDPAILEGLDDESVVDRLTDIRGIGPWTAKMTLLFGFGRPDVWPIEDLGIRQGIIRLADADLSRSEMVEVAERWRPYRSLAALHIWYMEDR